MPSTQRIEKQYPAWVRGGGHLSAIQKAEQTSDFFRTQKGAELYQKYLMERPEQGRSWGGPFGPGSVAKSQPTPGDVHVNAPLTQISVAFLQEMDGFIADQVFPNIPVSKQSDIYWFYPQGNFLRSQAAERAPASESVGTGYDVDKTKTYFAKPKAIHHDIPDQTRGNADPAINADRDATELVMRQLAIKREVDWATAFFTTSVWTGSTSGSDITPGTLWSAAGSTPFQDIDAQRVSVKKKSGGFWPNTLVLGSDVWSILKHHPETLDRIKGGATSDTPAIVKLQQLAAELELERVLVADAVYNPNAEGATAANAFVVGAKSALLCYSAPRPSMMAPSAGYIFSWTGYLGDAGPAGQRIKRFRMEQIAADRVEGEMAYDMKVVAAELGCFFSGVVA